MSTLTMLREEGRVEGELRGKTILSIEFLLKTIINFPNFSAKQITLLVVFKEDQISKFLTILNTQKLKNIQTFIEKEFLKTVKLNQKEQKEINKLVNQVITKDINN